MPPKQPAPGAAPQAPPPAPTPEMAPEKHSHIATWLFGLLFLVALIALVYSVMLVMRQQDTVKELREQKEAALEMIEDKKAELAGEEAMDEAEEEEGSDESVEVLNYSDLAVTFDYLEGWQVTGHRFYESPDRTNPEFYYSLNSGPYVVVSPSGGAHVPDIAIDYLDVGEEYVSIYGDFEWADVTEQEIDVNGISATMISYTAPEDSVYIPDYHEVIFVSGFAITHVGPADAEAWQLLQDSFMVTYSKPASE